MQSNVDSKFKVKIKKTEGNAVYSPWINMKDFYLQNEKYNENLIWITKKNYDEFGGENLLQKFCFANDYDE